MSELPAIYNTLTDAALMERLAKQDELAFLAIYQRYASILYKTAYRRLPVAHKAEDLVQEVFISLYRQRNSPDKITHLKAWLFVCLRRRVLNEIRNFRSHKKHDTQIAAQTAAVTLTQPEYDLQMLELQFHKALTQLTERCRQVFLMSRIENLPNKKIAAQLNISVQGVEKHVTNALRVMKKELGKHEPGMLVFLWLAQSLI